MAGLAFRKYLTFYWAYNKKFEKRKLLKRELFTKNGNMHILCTSNPLRKGLNTHMPIFI